MLAHRYSGASPTSRQRRSVSSAASSRLRRGASSSQALACFDWATAAPALCALMKAPAQSQRPDVSTDMVRPGSAQISVRSRCSRPSRLQHRALGGSLSLPPRCPSNRTRPPPIHKSTPATGSIALLSPRPPPSHAFSVSYPVRNLCPPCTLYLLLSRASHILQHTVASSPPSPCIPTSLPACHRRLPLLPISRPPLLCFGRPFSACLLPPTDHNNHHQQQQQPQPAPASPPCSLATQHNITPPT